MSRILPSILNVKDVSVFLGKLDSINMEHYEKVNEIHVDIMDGVFVESKCEDLESIKLIKEKGYLADVHLMVEKPKEYIDYALRLGADSITIHYEIGCFRDALNYLLELKNTKNIKIGISICPETDVSVLKPFLSKIDIGLVMSVHPGRGGQAFIEDTYNKIEELRNLSDKIRIIVDGGVNDKNIDKIISSGADSAVVGSYITRSLDEMSEKIESLI